MVLFMMGCLHLVIQTQVVWFQGLCTTIQRPLPESVWIHLKNWDAVSYKKESEKISLL